jgi:hypothetical protein
VQNYTIQRLIKRNGGSILYIIVDIIIILIKTLIYFRSLKSKETYMFSLDMPFGLLYVSTYLSCVIESVQNVEKSGVEHNYRIGKIDLCPSASFLGILAFSTASRRRKRKRRVLQTQIVRQCCYGSGRGNDLFF